MGVSMRGPALCGLICSALLACPAVAAADVLPDCWDVTNAAIEHRAAAPHPEFITYNETLEIQRDGLPFMRSRASIAYRDDGVVRIQDERFDNHPYVATFAEPGPPELGPYADRRSLWLPLPGANYGNFPLIGHVRARPAGLTCRTLGREFYHGHDVLRLAFSSDHPERPGLKGLLVDAQTSEIWKVVLSGFVPVVAPNNDRAHLRMTDFEVELEQMGRYLVVDHVTWRFSEREYSQTSEFFGEYYYSGFDFPAALPAGYFRT